MRFYQVRFVNIQVRFARFGVEIKIKARCAWKGRSTGCFPKAYKACEENAWRTSREMHGLPFAKHMAYEIGNIRQSRLLPGPTNQDTI